MTAVESALVMQDFGTKLHTVANALEDTGLTLLDLKTAKMVTGTEDGLTVRKFLVAAAPAKIVDLSRLQLKVRSAVSSRIYRLTQHGYRTPCHTNYAVQCPMHSITCAIHPMNCGADP